MGLNQYSDYGSGSSTSSSSSWMNPTRPSLLRAKSERLDTKSSSYLDLVMGRCTLEDVMREFQMNGSDSPYNPEEDRIWSRQPGSPGAAGAGAFVRQTSWPAPERSPPQRLPRRPRSMHEPAWAPTEFVTSTPVFNETAASFSAPPRARITPEQTRVLSSLPDSALYALLRVLHAERRAAAALPQECRFCKNNGEREAYYRSHVLKDAEGRVECPVLRAFVCRRCGATGDTAHTIKYCRLSTNEERIKSAAMMRSVRMASGRRRHSLAPPAAAAACAPVAAGAGACALQQYGAGETPLDPLWAALEQKLMV